MTANYVHFTVYLNINIITHTLHMPKVRSLAMPQAIPLVTRNACVAPPKALPQSTLWLIGQVAYCAILVVVRR